MTSHRIISVLVGIVAFAFPCYMICSRRTEPLKMVNKLQANNPPEKVQALTAVKEKVKEVQEELKRNEERLETELHSTQHNINIMAAVLGTATQPLQPKASQEIEKKTAEIRNAEKGKQLGADATTKVETEFAGLKRIGDKLITIRKASWEGACTPELEAEIKNLKKQIKMVVEGNVIGINQNPFENYMNLLKNNQDERIQKKKAEITNLRKQKKKTWNELMDLEEKISNKKKEIKNAEKDLIKELQDFDMNEDGDKMNKNAAKEKLKSLKSLKSLKELERELKDLSTEEKKKEAEAEQAEQQFYNADRELRLATFETDLIKLKENETVDKFNDEVDKLKEKVNELKNVERRIDEIENLEELKKLKEDVDENRKDPARWTNFIMARTKLEYAEKEKGLPELYEKKRQLAPQGRDDLQGKLNLAKFYLHDCVRQD